MNKFYDENRAVFENIFNNRFKIDLREMSEADFEKELLGYTWGFKARDLVYLYFDIQKEFEIAIPQQDIVAGGFRTLNGILKIAEKQLETKRVSA